MTFLNFSQNILKVSHFSELFVKNGLFSRRNQSGNFKKSLEYSKIFLRGPGNAGTRRTKSDLLREQAAGTGLFNIPDILRKVEKKCRPVKRVVGGLSDIKLTTFLSFSQSFPRISELQKNH